jgi:hypothetical protein
VILSDAAERHSNCSIVAGVDPLRAVTLVEIERSSITATTLGRSLKLRMAEATRNFGWRTNRGLMHQTSGKRPRQTLHHRQQ